VCARGADQGLVPGRSTPPLGAEYAYAFVSPRRVLASGRLHAVGEAFFKQLSRRNLRGNLDFCLALVADLNCQPVGGRCEGRVHLHRGVAHFPVNFQCAHHCGRSFEVASFLGQWLAWRLTTLERAVKRKWLCAAGAERQCAPAGPFGRFRTAAQHHR